MSRKHDPATAEALKARRRVEADEALRDHHNAQVAEQEKTARLRALRLAKEAADAKTAEADGQARAVAAKLVAAEKAKARRATLKANKAAVA